MPQNLISLQFSTEDIAALDGLMNDLEARLTGLKSLDKTTRRQITKMGDKSEPFVRQALLLLAQNPDVVPPGLGLADAQADLHALDQLRPLLTRMQRLVERMSDSEKALGSDAMRVALEGYQLLKVSGRHRGLEGLSAGLSARFTRTRRAQPEPAA